MMREKELAREFYEKNCQYDTDKALAFAWKYTAFKHRPYFHSMGVDVLLPSGVYMVIDTTGCTNSIHFKNKSTQMWTYWRWDDVECHPWYTKDDYTGDDYYDYP